MATPYDSRSLSYPNARLDRSGRSQPEFGFGRGDMAQQGGMMNWQSQQTSKSMPRQTYHYLVRPWKHGFETQWGLGSLLFIKREDQTLKTMYDLPLLRFFMRQSRELEKGNQMTVNAQPNVVGSYDANRQSKQRRARWYDTTYMTSMESVADNLTFAGLGWGESTPDMKDSSGREGEWGDFTGIGKAVPFVNYGQAFMPNLFGHVEAGDSLYMILKPIPANFAAGLVNPLGEGIGKSKLTSDDLVIDTVFFSSSDRSPPPAADIMSTPNGVVEQPPLQTRTYAAQHPDGSFEAKSGIVYYIGRSMKRYIGPGPYRKNLQRDDRPEMMTHVNQVDKMEIQLDVDRLSF